MDNDDIISIISHGCELARKLEGSLPNMMYQPSSISESCSEIIRAFMAAQEKLSDHHDHPSLFSDQHHLLIGGEMSIKNVLGMKEWLLKSSGYSYSQGMDQRMMECQGHEHKGATAKMITSMLNEQNQVACVGGSDAVRGSEKFQTGQSSGSSRPADSSSIKQRRSRRKKRDGWRMVRMAAPTIGNTEIPPEDGFTWRKYGQKEIHGCRFPRAYFRCTHQKLYHCPAKKQVQRLHEDPNTFEVTYRNDHTCHMSATAPAPSIMLPLSMPDDELAASAKSANSFVPATAMSLQNSTAWTTTSAGTWLSMGIGCPTPPLNPNMYDGLCCDMGGYNYQPVMDMADTMFNSGTGFNTSLDQIFSSAFEGKLWDQGCDEDLNGK